MAGLEHILGVFWKAGRCPVLVVNDTDHWGVSPEVAEGFFGQTARALGQRDMVLLVAAQTEYAQLAGYAAVSQTFTAQIALPALPDAPAGISRILQHRIDREDVAVTVDELVEPEALALVGDAYLESVDDGRGGDLRRTLAVVRTALELALNDPAAKTIRAGHVQEAIGRSPLTPARIL